MPIEAIDPEGYGQEPTVLPKTKKKVAGEALTQNVQAGGFLPMARSRLSAIEEELNRFDSEPVDMSGLQAYAKRQGESGNAAMLNALAAQYAGESFQPIQAQFLKRAAAASEPMKVSGGVLTPDGQFIKDPNAARDARRAALERQQQGIMGQIERFQTAEERRAQSERENQRDNETRLTNAQLLAAARQAASAASNAGKPPMGYRFKPDGSLEAIPGGPADTKIQGALNADTAALQSSQSALDRLEMAANEVRQHSGLSGIFGLSGMVPNIPGGAAANAQAKLEQLQSQAGFAVLQAMRDASKTGGALGQVSNFELQALQNNLAALQRAQSVEQAKQELKKIQDFARESKQRLQAAYNMKHSGGAGGAAQPAAQPSGLSPAEQAELEKLRARFGGR